MPPRLNLLGSFRALALRPRAPAAQWVQPKVLTTPRIRGFADDATTPVPPPVSSSQVEPTATSPPPPPTPAAPSSQEAQTTPPPSESTDAPVVRRFDDEEVSLAALDASRPIEKKEEEIIPDMDNEAALRQLEMMSYGINGLDATAAGHKYGLPELPIAPNMSMKHRYAPVLVQLTNLLMKDGKKSRAQRDMALVLNFLRKFPAPKYSPSRLMLPGAPPAAQLPLDPVTYVTLAIDSVAPLVKIRQYSGMAGGGRALPVPVPLAVRQRRRIAFQWVLDGVKKKQSRGSGKTQLAHRIAEEIYSIIEGRSSLWDKRHQYHRESTGVRANVASLGRFKKKTARIR